MFHSIIHGSKTLETVLDTEWGCIAWQFFFLFLRERAQVVERGRERERISESQAGSTLSRETYAELDTTTLGSWPDLKSRVRSSIDWATQVPCLTNLLTIQDNTWKWTCCMIFRKFYCLEIAIIKFKYYRKYLGVRLKKWGVSNLMPHFSIKTVL